MVMLILGIMAAFAYPAYSTWIPSYSLRSAAKDLYSNLHLAKGGAIKTNRPWAVIFDPSVRPGRYFICSDDKGDGWDGPPEMGGDDRAEVTVRLADYKGDVDFGHGEATKRCCWGQFSQRNISYTNKFAQVRHRWHSGCVRVCLPVKPEERGVCSRHTVHRRGGGPKALARMREWKE